MNLGKTRFRTNFFGNWTLVAESPLTTPAKLSQNDYHKKRISGINRRKKMQLICVSKLIKVAIRFHSEIQHVASEIIKSSNNMDCINNGGHWS
jgi:hypothetical protein